ncbi:MAG: alpha/beta hydrolase-fold protein [Phycisphaerales bacterium]|nr:alpha/beta hydrolase-fold protein [Phycisphaerales bacterium]
MGHRTFILAFVSLLLGLSTPLAVGQDAPKAPLDTTSPQGRVFEVRFSEEALDRIGDTAIPAEARVLLLLARDHGRLQGAEPLDAPFYSQPQPIASVGVPGLEPGVRTRIRLGDRISGCVSTPAGLDALEGPYRVRAVLDFGQSRSHADAGNLVSPITTIDLVAGEQQVISLALTEQIESDPLPAARNLRWVEIQSPMLSKALGRPVFHRAGVALPEEYDNPRADRRYWPTMYVVPGFGGDHREAVHYARLLANPTARTLVPQAVWVVLDPNDRLGHHGFADSESIGPRATALVEEFIPWLERRFRLVRNDPGQRIVTGHSSGGWSSLWLQLQHPEVFGACFSSAPDPVSFDAFITVNLYTEENLFRTNQGVPRASMRTSMNTTIDRVLMNIEEEVGMEYAIAPGGNSGEQWDTWTAMFSSIDPRTRRPRRAFDSITGKINTAVVEEDWSRFDINRLVAEDWERYGPLFKDRIRLLCGSRDSYYLERAVMQLKDTVDSLKDGDSSGPGYIEIVNGATHSTIVPRANERWYRELKRLFEAASRETESDAEANH